MKKIYFSLVTALLSLSAHAQFVAGLQFNYFAHPAVELKYPGLGLHIEFPSGDNSIRLAYNRGSEKREITYIANAYSSATNPSSIDVDGKVKVKIQMLSADYKRYLGYGDMESGGGYVFVGLALAFGNAVYDFESFDKDEYDLGFDPEEPEIALQSFIRLGIGYDYNIQDEFSIFGEAGLCIPPGTYNSVTGNPAVAISGCVFGSAGIKYIF